MDALTQAASLHLGECRIGEEQVRRALAMTETTSPSYLLMASLDWSVYYGRAQGLDGAGAAHAGAEPKIEAVPGLKTLKIPSGCGVNDRDGTRLVIDVSGRGLTGYEAQAHLEEQGVFIEMADARRLVLITTPSDDPAWYGSLLEALSTLPEKTRAVRGPIDDSVLSEPPVVRMNVRDATFPRSNACRWKTEGRVASEPVGVYPPGIALVMPGEELTGRAVTYLLDARARGGALFGVRNGSLLATAGR
jgi:arginine/lysine/ornithine decarboxylase